MFLPNQRSLSTNSALRPIVRPPVVPQPPTNLLQFLAVWSSLSEVNFKRTLRNLLRSQVRLKTFFRKRKIDLETFLDNSKDFIVNYLVSRHKELNNYVSRPLRTATTGKTYEGDMLLLQYGNVAAAFKGGLCPGSRLILGKLANPKLLTKTSPGFDSGEYPAQATNGYGADTTSGSPFAKYHNLDLTKQTEIDFWVNLKYSAPGVVTSLYLVPCGKYVKDISNATIADYKYYGNFVDDFAGGTGGLYSASQAIDYMTSSYAEEDKLAKLKEFAEEMGLGYNDSHGVGQCSSVEVNLVEMTPVSLSVTLHGVALDLSGNVIKDGSGNVTYDPAGMQVGVHGKINDDTLGGVCRLKKKQYNASNVIVDVSGGVSNPTWDTYGPSSSFWINTKEPFHVNANITKPDTKSLKLVVTITQDRNILELSVLSESGSFPDEGEHLDSMNLVVSQWAQSYHGIYEGFYAGSLWWLDGFKAQNGKVTDYRGWTVESDEQKIANDYDTAVNAGQVLPTNYVNQLNTLGVSAPYRNYSYAYNMAKAIVQDAGTSPSSTAVFSGIFDLQVWDSGTDTTSASKVSQSDFLPVWIQEAYSRGFVSDETKDAQLVLEWNGQYQSSYGILYDDQENSKAMFNAPTVVMLQTLDSDISGNAFASYQNTELKNYSLSSQIQRSVNSSSTPMKGISIKEVFAVREQTNKSSDYTIKNPLKMAEAGLNYIDATGVMINGLFFDPAAP